MAADGDFAAVVYVCLVASIAFSGQVDPGWGIRELPVKEPHHFLRILFEGHNPGGRWSLPAPVVDAQNIAP